MSFQPEAAWRPGGFWIRLAALLIDGVILGAISAAIFGTGASLDNGWTVDAAPIAYHPPGPAAHGTNLLADWLYFAIFEASPWSATPGKKLLGMVVVDLEGRRIGFGRATLRYFAKILSMLILFIGFLMVAWSASKRGLHDRIAGTQVVRRVALNEQVVPPGALG